MQSEELRYHGTYRYPNRATLDRAIAAARHRLDDDDDDDDVPHEARASMRCFVYDGVVLSIDVWLPATSDHRFAAAAVFDVLAQTAVEGAVEAWHGAVAIDVYTPEDD